MYEGKIIGSAGFHNYSTRHKIGDIGYWIDEDYRNRGIVTEVVKMLIEYGFRDLNLHSITIHTNELNIASKSIPEKLGFKLDGTYREARFDKHLNKFTDNLRYSSLKNEWESYEG